MEKIRIGDACDILNGYAFKSDKYVDDGIRVIRIANVQKGYIEDNAPAFYPIDSDGLDKYILEEGDLLMSLTGNVGRVALLQKEMLPAALNQRVACLRLKTDKITKGFLFHILNSDFFEQQCIQSSNGVAQKNMSTEWLKDYEIPLYSIEEQLMITEVLDGARKILSLRNDELSKLDDLIKARFVEMFENGKYERKPVVELCSDIVDCPHTTPKYEGELKNPAIRTSEIKRGYIIWDSMRYVSDDEYEERVARLRPEKGDIVYGREGTFGNAAILPEGHKFCLGQRVMLLRPNYSLCTSEYLLHAVISDDVYRQALEKNNASTVAHVNVKDVKNFMIPLPPLELQKEFAAFLIQAEKSKVIVQKSLEEIQVLLDSLMQQYFG